MDRKQFGDLPRISQVIPRVQNSPFSGLSSRTKNIAVLAVLIFLILTALTLSSVAIMTSADNTVVPKNPPLPSLAVLPLEDEVSNTTGAILPRATVWYHGQRIGTYESDSASVTNVLAHFNITLNEHDVLNFRPDETIYWGMEIQIDEIIYEEIATTEEIPFEVIEIPCQTIPKGTREIITEGVPGVLGKILYTKRVNGEISISDTKEETTFKQPVAQEVLVGTGGVFTAPDGTTHNYSYYIDVVATAYTHTGNRTYSGTVAEVGVIAVDPNYIPLRTNVYVIGDYGDYGVCRAEDIGGGIKKKRIDVFLDTEWECIKFGRRNMRCYVLE